MNLKHNRLAIDIFNTIMQFIPVYLFITILLYNIDSLSSLHTLILLPIPFISYLIKKHTRHIWSFLALHGLLLTIYLSLVSDLYLKIAAVIYLLLLTITAYYYRQKGRRAENTPAVLIALFILFYLACHLSGMNNLLQLCFVLSLVFVILYNTNQYLLNLERFALNHEGLAGIPFGQIRNSSHIMIGVLNGFLVLTMLLFSLLPLNQVFSAIGKLFLRLLRFLASLLHFKESEDTPEPIEESIFIEDLPITERSRFMEIILEFLQWTVVILAIVIILALILYALYQFYQYFYMEGEKEVRDKIEFLSPFTRKERSQREHHKPIPALFGRSNNARIRKYFARAVTSSLSSRLTPDKSLTPSQLASIILPDPPQTSSASSRESLSMVQAAKRKQLTEYYEKARYSMEECSREEVLSTKQLLKERL